MKTKFLFFSFLSCFLLLLTSCEKDLVLDYFSPEKQSANAGRYSLENRSGNCDGFQYSYEDVSINPDLLVLNDNNAIINSNPEQISEGILSFIPISGELSSTLLPGKIIYLKKENYTTLQKIVSVQQADPNNYLLQVTPAHLGELFNGGSIDLSIDLYEASKANHNRDRSLRNSVERAYEILNIQNEYDLNGLKYNPATNIQLLFHTKMSFIKGQLLPKEFSNSFEIQLAINPSINNNGSSLNKIYNDDLIKYIPSQIIDYIKDQEFNIMIPINQLGIDSLPAKVKIRNINIPTEIGTNLSAKSSVGFGVNGSFKSGYSIYIDGLKANVKTIYENNITAINPGTSELYGELISHSDIVITPSISILNDLYTVTGDIYFGMETFSTGNILTPENRASFGSKGVFTSGMNVNVNLLILEVPVTIFNSEKELWNIGNLTKEVIYSDLKWSVSKKYALNLLTGSKDYDTEFTVKYKYPIIGKQVPKELFISYDIYQDNNKTKITTVTDKVITPTNITDNEFKFSLKVPFKGALLTQSRSYLKNIVIRDKNGYVYEGIFNPAKGINENSFEIKR